MSSFIAILLIALLWGTADLLRKTSSGEVSSQLLAFVFNLGAAISPLVLLCWSVLKNRPVKGASLPVVSSLAGGLLVGVGGVLLFDLLSKGGSASTVFPSIRVLSLITVAAGGVLLFSEPINLRLVFGLILSLVGIYLLLLK